MKNIPVRSKTILYLQPAHKNKYITIIHEHFSWNIIKYTCQRCITVTKEGLLPVHETYTAQSKTNSKHLTMF
jgi:hypothetical protein